MHPPCPSRSLCRLCLTAQLLAAGHLHAAVSPTPAGRTFYASFDNSFDATECNGDGHGEVVGHPALVSGRRGRGLLVGDVDGASGVSYAVADHLDAERGAVAMWVQPQNWRGDDDQHHLFLSAHFADGGNFLVYKYHHRTWGLTFLMDVAGAPRNKLYVYHSMDDWQPGRWHHIVATWGRHEGMWLYIDGELAASSLSVGLTGQPLTGRWRLGVDWQRHGGRTVLDEVMVFGRTLAPHEVVSLAGRPASAPPPDEPRDIPGVAMAHAILGQKVLAQVHGDALGSTPIDTARLSLRTVGTNTPARQRDVPIAAPVTETSLDLTGLPHGRYIARLELLSAGRTQAVEELSVPQETDDTWQTAARIGKQDVVPPPFTPLRVEGDSVRCWGRECELAPSGLARQIRSQGEPLLAAPVSVEMQTSAGVERFTPGRLSIEVDSPAQSTAHGRLRRDDAELGITAVARYDGTVWTAVRFRFSAAQTVQRLRIVIPVTAGVAELFAYSAMGRVDAKRLGYDALPAGQGTVWQREFLPSVWIGNDRCGLGWYAESDQHWDIEGAGALTIERRGGAVVLAMNIIRQPRRVVEPFTIEFGLQATPVRPLPADWRSYQWVPSEDITRFFLHPSSKRTDQRPRGKVCYLYAYHTHFTNTLPRNPREFREMVRRVKSFGLLGTPYTDTTFLPEDDGDLWEREQQMVTQPGARGMRYGPVSAIGACHRGPFGDWFVWYVSHLVREYGCNGVYLDDMWPYGCSNAAHGCGYVGPDGKRRVTYPVRSRLETYRRLRVLFAETGKPFWINYHISGGRVPPLPTFGDCLLLGEDRNPSVAANPDYTENMTTAQWRAGYYPPAWGLPVAFLPQFKMRAEWMRDDDLAERLMAAVAPHDLMVWPIFSATKTVLRCRSVLERFGVGRPDVEFVPYWHSQAAIRCDDARLRVSAYRRPTRWLLCAANWTDDAIPQAAVSLRLPPASWRARDALSGESLTISDGRLVFAVPPKRLRWIEVFRAPPASTRE